MLEVRALAKGFGGQAPLFSGVDFAVAPGEWIAVVGESGSGKSTLLNIVAGLERPDAGTVSLEGRALDYGDDRALALWRRRHVGFVFQAFHLLPQSPLVPLVLHGMVVRAVDMHPMPGHDSPCFWLVTSTGR